MPRRRREPGSAVRNRVRSTILDRTVVTIPQDPMARAAVHRALGDPRRLRIVDALQLTDLTTGELATLTGLSTNLLAFHLKVLEDADVIARTTSEGDARRRYVSLQRGVLPLLGDPPTLPLATGEPILFTCTANSARSQLAAGLWRAHTGRPAVSAGTEPAQRVHPEALAVAARHGLDLSAATPIAYRHLDVVPGLVVSVCDRANEHQIDVDAPRLHWSISDPVPHGPDAFDDTFDRIAARIDRLARAA